MAGGHRARGNEGERGDCRVSVKDGRQVDVVALEYSASVATETVQSPGYKRVEEAERVWKEPTMVYHDQLGVAVHPGHAYESNAVVI